MPDVAEYPPETVFECQDLYCVDRLTFEAAAVRAGVSVATLKRWSDKYGWRAKREELAKAESDIRADTYRARARMLAKVVEEGGALDAFAVAKLETLAIEQARYKNEAAQSRPPEAVKIESPAQAAELLEKALAEKMGFLLASPGSIDLKVIKDLRDCLALVAEMRGREPDDDAQSGLTPETEAKIKQLLAEGL